MNKIKLLNISVRTRYNLVTFSCIYTYSHSKNFFESFFCFFSRIFRIKQKTSYPLSHLCTFDISSLLIVWVISLYFLQMNFANKIVLAWRDLMDNKSDPRTSNWLLMSSPFPTIFICLSYVYIVKVSALFYFWKIIISSYYFNTQLWWSWLQIISLQCSPLNVKR